IMRGLLVSFVSYAAFVSIDFGVLVIASFPPSEKDEFVNPFGFFAIFFLGLLFVGWLIAFAGALAGWLLLTISRRSTLKQRLLQGSRASGRTLRTWNAVGMALLLVSALPPFSALRASRNAELRERRNIGLISSASNGDISSVRSLLD